MPDYQLVLPSVVETPCKKGFEVRVHFYVQDVESTRREWSRQYVGRLRILQCLSGNLLELTVHILERAELALSQCVDNQIQACLEQICAERGFGLPPYTKGNIVWNIT